MDAVILEKLAELEKTLKKGQPSEPKKNVGKICLVRSYASGVHFGEVIDEFFTAAGKVVILKDSRRIHYWSGAASLTQIANDGIKNKDSSRLTQILPEIEVVNVCETIPISQKAIKQLESHPIWQA